MKHTSILRVLPYFFLAILVHALYNSLLSFDFIGAATGLIAALLVSFATIKIVISKIKKLDKQSS